MKERFKGKYEKELPVKRQIIASYIPIVHLFVCVSLGWRYGTLALLITGLMGYIFATVVSLIFGLVDLRYLVDPDKADTIRLFLLLGFVVIISWLVLHGFVFWHYIKKHNARVKANKSDVSSS